MDGYRGRNKRLKTRFGNASLQGLAVRARFDKSVLIAGGDIAQGTAGNNELVEKVCELVEQVCRQLLRVVRLVESAFLHDYGTYGSDCCIALLSGMKEI